MNAARLAAFFLVGLLPACVATAPPASTPARGAAEAPGWIRSELYFGVGAERSIAAGGVASRPQDAPIGEAQWRDFLDREVTPRFPDGLTVFDARGQWRYRDAAAPTREKTKVLVILSEDTPRHRADIEAIRDAWKKATGHESVLWSRDQVEVSF